MAKFDFNIGSRVHCKDGNCGKLLKVVVDPDTETITDLIVQKGILLTTDRVVPAVLVEKATEEEILLSINSDQLENYPEYREDEVQVPKPSWEREQARRAEEARRFRTIYGAAYSEKLMPTVGHRIHTGVPSDRVVMERGVPVKNRQGTIGKIDHMLVDRDSLEITHLVVNPGLLAHSMVMPISMVKQIGEEELSVDATDQELELLHLYTPRHGADVLVDLQEHLAATSFDFGDV